MKKNLLSLLTIRFVALSCGIAFPAILASPLMGQESITQVGVAVTQNFDSLGSSATAALPTGWKIGPDWSTGTTATTVAYGTTGAGVVTSSSSGGAVNWANGVTASSTERSLGFLSTGSYTSPRSVIYAFQNNTGSSISSITLTFNYEKFRSGTRAFNWTFFHGATPSAVVAATDGDQSYPADANSTTVSNPPSSTPKSFTISGLTIPNGGVYYLRWTYTGVGGSSNAQGLGIDDFSVTLTAAAAGIPEITSPLSASVVAFESSPNAYQIAASNTPSSFGATGLPEGLTVDTSTGVISGTATVPGTYPVVVSATNGQGTGSATVQFTVSQNPGAPIITSPLTATGAINAAFSYQITADNSPTSYSASNLHTGLSVDPLTGLISGTPTVSGTRNVTITASNALGTDSKTLVLTVTSPPAITSSLSGNAIYLGSAFSYQIAASGSPAPTSYGATGLPDGLTVDTASGLISGTPTAAGTSTIEVSATNTSGTGTGTFTLFVLDQAAQNAIPVNVVVNKYANGSATTAITVDKIQLLVIGNGTAGSTVDMRGMIIKDFSSNMANDGGGKLIFTTDALWSAVPAGTVIALSVGTTQTEDLNPADFTLAVNLGNTTYFTSAGGSIDIGGREMVMIKAAGTGANGVAGGIHALAGGVAGAQFTSFTGAKLIATAESGAGTGIIANNSTSTLADYGTSGAAASTDATGNISNSALDFASWNNTQNETYILSLRGAGPATPTVNVTGSAFNAFSATAGTPSAAQTVSVGGSNLTGAITITAPTGFEVSSDGTTFSSSVSLTPVSGSVAATTISVRLSGTSAGSFNGDVSFASTGATTQTRAVSGTVTSAYDAWAASFSLTGANALPTADPDNDGFNNNNEYAFGTNPTVSNGSLLSTTASGGNLTVTWIERNNGFTYAVQSTTNLATTAFANDGSVVPSTSGNQVGVPTGYTRKQFTVPASNNKFFRIRATPAN